MNLAVERTAKHLYNRIREPFTWDGSPPVSDSAREQWRAHVRSAVEAGLIELVMPHIPTVLKGQMTTDQALCDHEFEKGEDPCMHCGVSYKWLFDGPSDDD
jgi:hypothetical protein